MDEQKLMNIAKTLTSTPGKGILAADESAATCEKRFSAVGVPCTQETRRTYRSLLITAPRAKEVLSGVIFYDETVWQHVESGETFVAYCQKAGMVPGIKLDEGLADMEGHPGEKVSKGLATLEERLPTYVAAGLQFAKWRSVITIGEGLPSKECIEENARILAQYAIACQKAGMVPIVEPEVLLEGNHGIERSREVLNSTLSALFAAMHAQGVYMPGAILKTSMVVPGKDSAEPMDNEKVAQYTSEVLLKTVPQTFGGVVFLSGGQTSRDAFLNLSLIKQKASYPWGVTFSYSRALQDSALKAFAQNMAEVAPAQQKFNDILLVAAAAAKGQLTAADVDNMDSFVSRSQDV